MQPPRPSSTSTGRSIPSGASSAVSQADWPQHAGYTSAPATSPLEATSQTGHHQDPGSVSDMRWSPQVHPSVSQSLPAVPETAFHDPPQIGYYGPDHASRTAQYAAESGQTQPSLPYVNPSHQQSHAPQQGSPQSYGYPAHAHPQHNVADYAQPRSIPSQPTSYASYNQHQNYMGSAAPHPSAPVQHAGEGLQMMHQQNAPQSQGGHMMYNMKVEQ